MNDLTPKKTEPYYEEEVSPEAKLAADREQIEKWQTDHRRAEAPPPPTDPPKTGLEEIDKLLESFPDTTFSLALSGGKPQWTVRVQYEGNTYYGQKPTLGEAVTQAKGAVVERLDGSIRYHEKTLQEVRARREKLLSSFAGGPPGGRPGGGGS